MAHDYDSEIVNLSGGLFAYCHVTAPFMPFEPQLELAVPHRSAAMAQARRAHRASRFVGIVAAAVLVGGFAAAQQAAPTARTAPTASVWEEARDATPSPVRVAAATHHRGGNVAAPPAAEAPATPESTHAGEVAVAPEARPRAPSLARVLGQAQHRRDVAASIPLILPIPSRLAALGAPRVGLDPAAGAVAVSGAARRASACLARDDPRRTMRVRVTFSPSGRVESAAVAGGPFVGTATGSCIASALRGAHVRAFEGESITVSATLHL